MTVGRPGLGVTGEPSGPLSVVASMSTTKIRVSPTSMPACALPPEASYPSEPGMAMSTLLPCFCPVSPFEKPGTTWARLKVTGWPRLNDSSNFLPVRPLTP